MNTPEIQAALRFDNSAANEAKPGFRTKVVSMRLTPEELTEIESAAEGAGQSLTEWQRETTLRAARQRPADPVELLLAEVWALRYSLLNLFQAGAQAASEGKQLLPDSILEIRDQADARKLQQARKLLAEFLAQGVKKGDR
ncbi:MAG: plasmid mobilization protein [Acidobacteriaceae bacterium]